MKTITISRQYGSGGRYIAALLSEKMGVPCYDSKFLPKEAERHGISQEIINVQFIIITESSGVQMLRLLLCF